MFSKLNKLFQVMCLFCYNTVNEQLTIRFLNIVNIKIHITYVSKIIVIDVYFICQNSHLRFTPEYVLTSMVISHITVVTLLNAHIYIAVSEPSPSIKLTRDTDEQIRRDSILFEEVSQGLEKIDTTGPKVEDKCKS